MSTVASSAAVSIALALFAVLVARGLGWLTPGAAIAAWALGTVAFAAFGAAGLAALFAPFLVATLLGRLPGPGARERRTARQVVANGGVAFAACLLAFATSSIVPLAVFLGSLAALGADTCATEVGTRWGGAPRSLVTLRPLRRGESGGVTVLGLLASAGGALLAPLAFVAVAGEGPRLLGVTATAGFVGSLVDSVLGATVQFRGVDPVTDAPTERTHVGGRPVARRSGLRLVDNDAVNLLGAAVAGLIAAGWLGLNGAPP